MSTEKNGVSESPSGEAPVTKYHDAAQSIVEELRSMREKIPHFAIPATKRSRAKLNTAASLSPEFIELATVARANSVALVRGDTLTAAESRELMAYADAYAPVAAELAAMAQFVLYSVDAAKAKVGSEALTTYALAVRLSRRPEHADLAPHAEGLRRALGNRGKRASATRKKQQAAASATPKPSEEK